MELFSAQDKTVRVTSTATFDPNVTEYVMGWEPDTIQPKLYSDWKTETLSWKTGCTFHTQLSGLIHSRLKGPDASALLDYVMVNNFDLDHFKVGRAKHAVGCDEEGYVEGHGLVIRRAEDEFDLFIGTKRLEDEIATGKWDVEPIHYGERFVFQIGGPKSLEVIENIAKQDIHDIPFMGTGSVKILGIDCLVVRMGMSGTLAYEIQGPIENVIEIYDECVRVGEPLGLVKMANLAYCCQHTENGFMNDSLHFWDSLFIKAGGEGMENCSATAADVFRGSLADQPREAYMVNPLEADFGRSISWRKEKFVGKEALEKLRDDPKTRKLVTLVWNPEDILKVYATLFDEGGDIACQFGFPRDSQATDCWADIQDKVLDADGNLIGKSMGRVYTYYYRKVISLCCIDPEFSEIGTEVTVLWGDPGTRQVPIRATVAKVPFLDLVSNKDFDVETVPHYRG